MENTTLTTGLDKFCGSQFWNISSVWNTDDPNFTRCFEKTVLVWIPCFFLWLFTPLEIYYIVNSFKKDIPWNWLNSAKLFITSVLCILMISDFATSVQAVNSQSVPNVDIYTPVLKLLTFLLSGLLLVYDRKYGIRSSGLLFLFWGLTSFFGAAQYRTEIRGAQQGAPDSYYQYVSYLIYYPLVLLMLFLNCFADQPPRITKYTKSQLAMDTDDDAVVGVVTTLLLSKHKKKSKLKKRRYWVHPYNHINLKHGSYIVSKELSEHPDKFQSFYRMSVQTFSRLVSLVGPHIIKKDTNFRLALGVEEKLLITLRYLATGSSFRTLSFYFMRGETTIGYVVNETCKAIWKYLRKEYMPLPSENMWLEIARRYEELWNMPNCIGSIDGKHIRIQAPPKCGSAYYNYKSYNSIVLMAIVDADSMFTMISVGDYGRNSDGAVFTNSRIGGLLNENKLHIPPARSLPCDSGGPFPMFFVADEAFALRQELMKPYPQRTLNNERRIFNYRLSRARKSVECAFGILCSKFRVFYSPIACNLDKAENIVKAACVLHNFIRKHDGVLISSDTSLQLPQNLNPSQLCGRPTAAALQLRDRLCQYFVKLEVALPWQNTVCV